jgi:HD domain
MNILKVYEKYQIMPNLAEHQIRVAAVGQIICENLTLTPSLSERDGADIVAALLLHDMGNLIKFDLTKTYSVLNQNVNIEFWQKVKEGYVQKYGADEHEATIKIAKELGVTDRVIELVDCIGFNTANINAESEDFSKKICAYSDIRVWPHGVTTLEKRLADLRERYDSKFHQMGGDEAKRLGFENSLRKIEQQIFEHCKIKPEDITEQAITDRKEKLKAFEI